MRIARLFVLCFSLLGLPVFAATVPNLYQVHEPVSSQQPGERDAGLVRALQTLLVRLTGNPQAPQNPALAGYLKDPQQLISQYAFENGPPLALVVDFDPTATGNALRAAGLPSWGANRPAVLAWWLNESADGSSLVGDNQASAEPLKRAAQNRGLPLRLPLADLDEQIVGTPENLTAAQPDALRAASERYAADALLAVDAKEADGKWQAQWRLWMGDSREQGQAEGATPDALADSPTGPGAVAGNPGRQRTAGCLRPARSAQRGGAVVDPTEFPLAVSRRADPLLCNGAGRRATGRCSGQGASAIGKPLILLA